ncbi:phosphoinositide phosphatase SAC2-like isoform X2 [Curcuma longa]|uniref:phosphoinositide phosphatase SAC2-like isoform X2 n=1 Tax=Curcuma longa TaxID=136217 RepID=UPI003D9E73A0
MRKEGSGLPDRMAAGRETEDHSAAGSAGTVAAPRNNYLRKFRLYETRSTFYVVGNNKDSSCWRVLKINRLEPSELSIHEDPRIYSENECRDMLTQIHEKNIATDGLRFVTKCYGIVGFVKFLGPYYMLLITRRRKVGTICGHSIYAVSKSEMITLPNSDVLSNITYSKDENSYSYNIMRSLQINLCDGETKSDIHETMFVWNAFLTCGVRDHLHNTTWIVALVYGFFKQAKICVSGKYFWLTLIARRSRHFAGTRYLKRGVNEKGEVANDVEIEQIVSEDIPGGISSAIASVVQNRGSIPLFWSQQTSKFNLRPDIILHKKDKNFDATRLHFDNLVKRYGNPIIILNLIKSFEKKPRESLLHTEFTNAIDSINKDLSEEKRLKFLHWDIQNYTRRKGVNVLESLGKVAACTLEITGYFYCQLTSALKNQNILECSQPLGHYHGELLCKPGNRSFTDFLCYDFTRKDGIQKSDIPQIKYSGASTEKDGDTLANEVYSASAKNEYSDKTNYQSNIFAKPIKFQKGILRTNCIDCLDRTNVAQYAFGLAALGHQLHAVGSREAVKITLHSPLADDLMVLYEKMGDKLALQYGGSPAHNKIFSERRGQWKAATQSQEFLRTIQRHYSNAYMDVEKQHSINLFLGYFQPQQGKPALWDLDASQPYSTGRNYAFADECTRSFFVRSLSDGNVLSEGSPPLTFSDVAPNDLVSSSLPARVEHQSAVGLWYSTPEIFSCENNASHLRNITSDDTHICFSKHKLNGSDCSNFLDFDWLSSAGNSCKDEEHKISSLISSPNANFATENVTDGVSNEVIIILQEESHRVQEVEANRREPSSINVAESSKAGQFSDKFAYWVDHGGTFSY